MYGCTAGRVGMPVYAFRGESLDLCGGLRTVYASPAGTDRSPECQEAEVPSRRTVCS